MTQYLLLVHGNLTSCCTTEEWDTFFRAAQDSGLFRGGSEIGSRIVLGNVAIARPTDPIVAYMRFDSDDKQRLLDLLKTHPVILHGGSVELCELPES